VPKFKTNTYMEINNEDLKAYGGDWNFSFNILLLAYHIVALGSITRGIIA
jgi:hypothetical protein